MKDHLFSVSDVKERTVDDLVCEFLVLLAQNGVAPDVQEALLKNRALHKAIVAVRKR